ncbi:MAG: sigma-70 family RNA polymerase sigma factor [Hyphomonadaceae bacterium]|nr:sigma-70 family RNA polymerase sigma factor [Hyphomonadaceae bacterium]
MARIAENRCRTSFAELFEFFAPRLNSYMRQLGADPAEAEELAQEVMITLWRKADQYDPAKASVSTWIFRIARNRRIDAHRRTRRPELDPDEPMLRPPEPEQPDITLDRVQMEERVRAQMETLPPEQLELLRAAFYQGLSHSEIAKAFNLPLGTVKSRIRLAFSRLRGQIEEEP